MKLRYGRVYHSTGADIPHGLVRKGDDISRILIDGYNLIGVSHRTLGAERDRLILALSDYRKKKGHEITVVFDGWKSGERFPESQVRGGVKVVYTRLGDTADSVIKEIVSDRRNEWIVITSDRDIAAFVWANGSVPIESERFQRLLERAGRREAEHDLNDADTADEGEGERKGRSRTPSKKEKALMRVLRRL